MRVPRVVSFRYPRQEALFLPAAVGACVRAPSVCNRSLLTLWRSVRAAFPGPFALADTASTDSALPAVAVLAGFRALAVVPAELGLTAHAGAGRDRQRTGLQVADHHAGRQQIDA